MRSPGNDTPGYDTLGTGSTGSVAAASDDPDARRRLTLDHVANGRFDAALALLPRLAAEFPHDAVVQLALAEATWGNGDATGALPWFEASLARDPAGLRIRARYGLALLAASRPTDSLAQLEAVTATLPLAGPPEALAEPFMAPLAFEPIAADAALQLGQVLLCVGMLDPAIAALRRAAALDPSATQPLLILGSALEMRGDDGDAHEAFHTAARLDPAEPLVWTALARAVRRFGQIKDAETYDTAAHALSRDLADRELSVGNALLAAGAADAAHDWFARSLARASWARAVPAAGPASGDGRLRVGVLASAGRANTPFDFILDGAAHALEVVLMLDGFAYPHARIAASYDVLFNAVADADQGADAVRLAGDLVDRVALPVLNHPRAIADTTREGIAARLAGIAGCTVPATGRYTTRSLRGAEGRARAAAEIGLPLLARPVGSHGGTRLERLESEAAIEAYLGWTTSDALYLTRYHDFRSRDGTYRKYRFIYVDGEILPYHLAIGGEWLVHYVRTPMAEETALRDQEAAFLADWRGHVGARAAAALAEIGARMALDYCGVDCAVLQDGGLLLFECNAAMLVRHAAQPAMFDYKRAPAERIRDAVSRLLERRAAAR
jgi:tetratricopeptide (TPR) repeat protein